MKNEIKIESLEDDLIRREDAIQIILHQWAHVNSADDAIQLSVDKIRKLPSVKPLKNIVNTGIMNVQI